MKRFKKILVCVDGSRHDAPMIDYTGGRSRVCEADEIHFLSVNDPEHPTAEDADAVAELTEPALQALVNERFAGHGQEKLICKLAEGTRLLEVLRYTADQDIDLVILSRYYGRETGEDDQAVLARRISRKATCSVLVLPEQYAMQAGELIVPVRDSDCSAQALEVACGIAEDTGARVTALNIFYVTPGYSRVGKTLEEHSALLKAGAERECERLLQRTNTHGITVSCNCLPDMRDDPVPVILGVLGDGTGKAVVIGARGRSGAAGVLLGKVTERLIREAPSGVLAVKTKGESLGIVQALLIMAGQQ